jgi:glycosyltransferase involved in cell wall biosynthesis
MDFPFVSVIVAAYNSADTIERCIRHLLELDYPRYEVIVVDNNSTDDTPQLVQQVAQASCLPADRMSALRQFPVAYLQEKKPGWPAARNTAIQHSQARFVANIDADCFAERDWLKNLMRVLLNDEKIGGVVGKTKVEPGRTLVQQFYAASDPFNLEGKLHLGWEFVPWGGGNNVYRKEVFERIGYYDSDRYKSGADPEFHQRMKRLSEYTVRYVPDALIWHVARGTLKELFAVSAKYSFNGRQRAIHHAEFRNGYEGGAYLKKQLRMMTMNTLGFGYRLLRFAAGRETKLRLVSPLISNVERLGAIYGYLKAGWQERRRADVRR